MIVYALWFEQLLSDGRVLPSTAIRSALLGIRNGNVNETTSVPAHGQRAFEPQPNEIQISPSIVRLDGAVFDNGEFIGPNLSSTYEWITSGLNAQQDLHKQVLANRAANVDPAVIWSNVQAIASNQPVNLQGRAQWNYAKRQQLFAQELLKVKELSGEEAAYELASKSANLPTIWRAKGSDLY